MHCNRNQFSLAVLSSFLLGLSACAAPVGPIGGQRAASWLQNCHLCGNSSICDEDDPTITPPHPSFHPLPTRPVFSPPPEIPGVYVPWPARPDSKLQALPPNSAMEVQNQFGPQNGSANVGRTAYSPTDADGGPNLRR